MPLRDALGGGQGRDGHAQGDPDDGARAPDDGARAPSVVAAKVRAPGFSGPALPRERLEARMAAAFERRLTLVIAPAGSGKTTLIGRFAAVSGAPVAWYRAEAYDADERTFVRHVEAALLAAVPGLPGGAGDVTGLAAALGEVAGPDGAATTPVILVIDDLHTLEDTPAEAALARLVDYAPLWLTTVVGSRVAPGFNLSRLRVAGDLLEIGTDDLRFRAWEVEQLFRDIYDDPVPPADLAVLARRTEGWAAGLQLFHLATRGRSAEERRRVLGGPGSSGRMLREYLAQNVLGGLPGELRDFLLDTYVLARLSGPLCDRLRGAQGSAALLDELARRGIFTIPMEDGSDDFRYHEVLRQHLDRMMVEVHGEAATRDKHAEAGRVLEEAGLLPEALRAYSRAEDWSSVRRVLGGHGERLADSREGRWIEELPPAIERHDPWVAVAAARRARNDGRWAAALAAYAHAEQGLGPARAAEVPHAERMAVLCWVDPSSIPPPGAFGMLRSGLVRDPGAAGAEIRQLDDPAGPLARGLLALAAGNIAESRRLLEHALGEEAGGPVGAAAAALGLAVLRILAGEPSDGSAFDAAAERAERAGSGWLARLAGDVGRTVTRGPAPTGRPVTGGERAHDAAAVGGDHWSGALLALADAWAAPDAEVAGEAADQAADLFRRLGSGVLEGWARGLGALAASRADVSDARAIAVVAADVGRATATPAARLLAQAALEHLADPAGAVERARASAGLAGDGLALPPWALPIGRGPGDSAPGDVMPRPFAMQEPTSAAGSRRAVTDAAAGSAAARPGAAAAAVRIRTLGGCALEVDGHRIALDGAKPRVRSLLRLLAVHAGAPVHREVIQEALWPDADATAGARSLHVALSALRKELDEVAHPPGGRLVVRDGDAYRLDVRPGDVDLGLFDRAIAAGRTAHTRGEVSAPAFAAAIELYSGDLLPEEGPAEWVAERRDQYRAKALEAAEGLASEALLTGDLAACIRACHFGLALDRYQDALWRLLIAARERAGETGAASRDRREYALVLEALGVTPGVGSELSFPSAR
jgi:DNA-binding SARP family transcriptional activator